MERKPCICGALMMDFIYTLMLADQILRGKIEDISHEDQGVYQELNQRFKDSLDKIGGGCQVHIDEAKKCIDRADTVLKEAEDEVDIVDRLKLEDSYYCLESSITDQLWHPEDQKIGWFGD